jgi:hypothetical protein
MNSSIASQCGEYLDSVMQALDMCILGGCGEDSLVPVPHTTEMKERELQYEEHCHCSQLVGLHKADRMLPDHIEVFWLISAKTLPISVNKNLTLPLPDMVCRPFLSRVNRKQLIGQQKLAGNVVWTWQQQQLLDIPRPIGYGETNLYAVSIYGAIGTFTIIIIALAIFT